VATIIIPLITPLIKQMKERQRKVNKLVQEGDRKVKKVFVRE